MTQLDVPNLLSLTLILLQQLTPATLKKVLILFFLLTKLLIVVSNIKEKIILLEYSALVKTKVEHLPENFEY